LCSVSKRWEDGLPVVFAQHDGGAGDVLAEGAPGFALRPELAPRAGEAVVVKRFCSAFQGTTLGQVLAGQAIDRVIVCGLQSEFCVDTTCRAAFERGLKVTLVSDAHTTFDNAVLPAEAIRRHHTATLGGAFAKLVAAAEVRFGG
jgi:nicotinamidase-related amidase